MTRGTRSSAQEPTSLFRHLRSPSAPKISVFYQVWVAMTAIKTGYPRSSLSKLHNLLSLSFPDSHEVAYIPFHLHVLFFVGECPYRGVDIGHVRCLWLEQSVRYVSCTLAASFLNHLCSKYGGAGESAAESPVLPMVRAASIVVRVCAHCSSLVLPGGGTVS